MSKKDLAAVDDIEIEALSDEDLDEVAGGAEGSFCCCTTGGGNCSRPKEDDSVGVGVGVG